MAAEGEVRWCQAGLRHSPAGGFGACSLYVFPMCACCLMSLCAQLGSWATFSLEASSFVFAIFFI